MSQRKNKALPRAQHENMSQNTEPSCVFSTSLSSKGMPLRIGGHLGPMTRYCHYGANGDLVLAESFDAEDPWWGLAFGGYPEQSVIVGRTQVMLRVFGAIVNAAPFQVPVFVEGETGTGKELVARALASVKKGRFEAVNCGLPGEGVSFEDRFFGRVDKIVGGAPAAPGAFQLAHNGTLFIDNIDCLTLPQQVKLLRTLDHQPQRVRRVGSAKDEIVDARIVAATNQNPELLVEQGRFRPDLFARLKVVRIILPPLRARREDISLLTAYFLLKKRSRFPRKVSTIARETLEQLCAYDWSLNIRDLSNRLESALVLGEGPVLGPEDFDLEGRRQWGTEVHLPPSRRRNKDVPAGRREARIEKLMDFLKEKPGATVRELTGVVACSSRTIQRDLATLSSTVITPRKDETDRRVVRYYVSGVSGS